MYEVFAYGTPNGSTPYREFLETVRRSGDRNALRRFQDAGRKLEQQGLALLNTSMMDNIVDDIYELRVGPYRIFCFYDRRSAMFVLLNGFRKQTQRTPEGQISRARALVNQYLDMGGDKSAD